MNQEWTSTHQNTMQDGWYVDIKYFFIVYSNTIANHGG